MSVRTIIHIGIVKAASSTLQGDLFALHSGLHHIGVPWRTEALSLGFNNLTSSEIYNFDTDELRALCAMEQDAAAKVNRIASVSAEAFSICDRANRVMIAERLHGVCGPSKIVAVLRNQIDWLSSRYVHNYAKSIPETRLKFDDWLYSHWKRDTFSYRHHADFDTMLRVYGDVFGMENIHVMLLEDLIADKRDFVLRLCEIMGIEAEEGFNLLASAHREKRSSRLGYMRRRLGLLPNIAFSQKIPKPIYDAVTLMVGGKMNPVFTDEWRSEIENYYRAGNRNVAARFGIDLGARGYAV